MTKIPNIADNNCCSLSVILSMEITNTIRSLRERRGLTQEDIAERLNVTRSNYAYLEGRGSKLTIEQLEKIAVALNASLKEILFGEESNERVGEYRDRVFVLEERLADKNDLITHLKRDLENVERTFQDYLYFFDIEYADMHDIKIYNVDTGNGPQKMTIKEYLTLPPEVRQAMIKYEGDEGFEIGPDEEIRKPLYKELFQSDIHSRAMMLIFDSDVLDDDDLRKAGNKYANRDFTKLPFRLANPLHDKKG